MDASVQNATPDEMLVETSGDIDADDEDQSCDSNVKEEQSDNTQVEEDQAVKGKELRTCTATLGQLLGDDRPNIERLLDTKQEALFDFKDEMGCAAFKVTLAVCQGLLHEDKRTLDLREVFPPFFQFRDKYFQESPVILAGAVTDDLCRYVTEGLRQGGRHTDALGMLRQGFLQYMAARVFGTKSITSATSEALHPTWDKCIAAIQDTADNTPGSSTSTSIANTTLDPPLLAHQAPTGLSTTLNALHREQITDISNLWEGGLYTKLRNSTLRYCLKLWLRLAAEQRYRNSRANYAQQKQEKLEKKADKKKELSHNTKNWKRRSIQLFDQLDHTIAKHHLESWTTPHIAKVLNLIDIHEQQRPIKPTASTTRLLTYVDKYTIRLTGYVNKDRAHPPVRSKYEEKRKKHKAHPSAIQWEQERQELGLSTVEAKNMAESKKKAVESKTKELNPLKKRLTSLEQALSKAVEVHEACGKDDTKERLRLYGFVQDARAAICEIRPPVLELERSIRTLKQETHYLNSYTRSDKTNNNSSNTTNNNNGSSNSNVQDVEQQRFSEPSFSEPAMQDFVESTSIDRIQGECTHINKQLGPSATDRGLSKMHVTVPVKWNTLLALRNRFDVLSDESAGESDPVEGVQDSMDEPSPSPSRKDLVQSIKFAEANVISARHMQQISGVQKATSRREKRLRQPKSEKVRDAHAALAGSSLHNTQTLEEIEAAQEVRRKERKHLRAFEMSAVAKKERYLVEMATKRAWAVVAADERRHIKGHINAPSPPLDILRTEYQEPNHSEEGSGAPSSGIQGSSNPSSNEPVQGSQQGTVNQDNGFCSDCSKHHLPDFSRTGLAYPTSCPSNELPFVPVLFVGTAGVCNGGRLGGHLKYGGNRVIEQHMCSSPVCMIDEQNTSKVCPFCFQHMRLARATKIVDGQRRSVRVNRAVECVNPSCLSFQLGYTKRARDSNASMNIALNGLLSSPRPTVKSFLLTKETSDQPSPPLMPLASILALKTLSLLQLRSW
ncbi:hypothetical protein BGX33_000092 [Mortierella sp. NVP41]|nr:hypothetical protein BGX33_000092 [Mortierella sp. NVP41]